MSSSASPEPVLEGVRRMLHHMRRRGPDAEGVWSGPGVLLGHRRLAILDLAARANQPLVSADQRFSIVFNGEIYNFRDLRQSLKQQGVSFRTTSDTEVLLALYGREGADMLGRLRGMFALAIWDTATRELFLARDPYGIKPLYYAPTKTGLVFASQVKALVASQLTAVSPEPAGIAGFHLWGSVPEPWTLYRNVLALPAGHCLRVRDGAPATPVCWHDIRVHWRENGAELPNDLAVRVREALTDSVRAHLVSDVPVSVFLSGGVDSAVLSALARELGVCLEGITVGFEEFAGGPDDEVGAAAATAAHYGMPHHERRVSASEFARDAPRILTAMDQPSIDGVNTWFASKAAAERGHKVVLSGVGGDELFCGYSSFARVRRTAALGRLATASGPARTLFEGSLAYLGKRLIHPKLAGLTSLGSSIEGAYFLSRGLFLPQELPALIGADMAQEGLARLAGSPLGIDRADARDMTAAVGLLESTCYLRNQLLRDGDWASMDHSLELRTPLVDSQLLAELAPFVSGFRSGVGKALMSQSPVAPLPAAIASRPKTGFGVPMARWLSNSIGGGADQRQNGRLHGKFWARHWAAIVMANAMSCA
jgi:asparagine synthase (glutamine-hydrolysing)